jgi:MFS family permease
MKFDELAEVYTSMSLRSFGFGVIGIFVPVFLYKNGVDLTGIFFFYALFFALRIPVAYIAAFVVARIGPKHSIAVSTILLVAFLMQLLSYPAFGWPLATLAFSFTIANGLFFVAYNVDFSKIKSNKHGGKELGWLYIFERAGSALGPFVGGLLATFVSPLLTIGFAMAVLLGSLVPLFFTNEPVKVHQKITFKGFKWKNHKRDFMALAAFNVENVATGVMWPLLIAVFIFTTDTYAKLGSLIAVAMVLSMVGAHMFGKFIDNKKGYYLLTYGTLLNAITHVFRSFITAGGGAVAVSLLNEPTTLSYRMPLVKGFYDAADSEDGYRIVYLVVTEALCAAAKSLYCAILLVCSYFYDPILVLRYSFVIVAIISLGILWQRFPALKKV